MTLIKTFYKEKEEGCLITVIKKKITAIGDRDPLTEKIIGCAYKVHSQLGPGFNENTRLG